MATKKIKKKDLPVFNVIFYDVNGRKFVPYDIIPYFVSCYLESGKRYNPRPTNIEEFREMVVSMGKYRFWGRCEYEFVLESWCPSGDRERWDVWDQIEMNLDLITRIVMDAVGFKEDGNDKNPKESKK